MTAPTTSPRDVALAHYRQRQAFVEGAAEVAGQLWTEVNPNNIADSWAQKVPELTAVISGAQLGTARQADSYVDDALDAQGIDSIPMSPIDPAGFAGQASDARGLVGLLTNPVIVTLLTIQDGFDVARALGVGRANLDMITRTQVADAGRLADQVAITTRPNVTGYVRVAVGNTCARCLLLAGRRYEWNTGFQRHPRCDCIHLPAGIAQAGKLTRNPQQIYDRMTTAQRSRAGFTKADQRALREGADLGRIINARRGGLSTAGAGARARRGGKVSVDEIYRRAGNDRGEALRLLESNGYIQPRVFARTATPTTFPAAATTAATTDPALKMTVAQLKAIAKANKIMLFSATRKADILDWLRIHERNKGVKLAGLPEFKPPPRAVQTFGPPVVAPPLAVPAASSPVLTGSRFNVWSDEFVYGPLGTTLDTPAAGFRVQDLRITVGAFDRSYPSYVVRTGTAWRFGEISYLIEHASADFGAPWVSRALQELRAAHAAIPAAARANKSYALLSRGNPADVYWAKKYNTPNFESAMTAGQGTVQIWKFDPRFRRVENLVDSLRHETGHNLDDLVGRVLAGSKSPAWATAADADAKTAARIQDLRETHIQARGLAKVQPSKGWPKGVTEYGRSSEAEDWAESVMLYQLGPIATGRLPGRVPPNLTGVKLPPGAVAVTGSEVLYFRDIYPRRAAILDKLFPEIAKRQKAEIAAMLAQSVPTDLTKLTVTKLRALAKERGVTLPSRALKADIIAAINRGPVGKLSPEDAARARQAIIDDKRAVADALAEVAQLLDDGASARALSSRAANLVARHKMTLDVARSVETLIKAMKGGDAAAIRRATTALQRKTGLKIVGGTPGKTGAFDRKQHEAIGGERLAPGDRVVVVRPGFSVVIDGETVRLSRAVVERAPAVKAVKAAAKIDLRALLTASIEEKERIIRPVFEGKFGSLTAKVRRVVPGRRGDEIGIDGVILDSRGHEVGNFSRSISLEDIGDGPQLWADHGVMEIFDARLRGTGFATGFNAQVFDWYRRSGVYGVSLSARDIGKYVWATQGFDFQGPFSAEHTLDGLRELVGDLRAGRTKNKFGEAIAKRVREMPDLDAQLTAAEALLDRAARFKWGQSGYPTAYEISQLGRRAGQKGKSAVWLGKYHMLQSAWEGQLIL